MKLSLEYLTPIGAILAIMVLDIIALCNGINGVAFTSSCALIAGIAGYKIKSVKDKIGPK